ncbi:unnamed protein product [Mesocestoides corti]|uniref:Uncharacterized protein n=1 Tax=Mesocestoides corti TaxID=53468 RepID=A0A3P6GVU9_MESCO|nr:unnamed protein product [Mesocestoides corti]
MRTFTGRRLLHTLHGFYRLCRTRLRPCFLESYWYHRLYDIVTNMAAMFSLNYLGIGFFLLDASLTLQLWGSFYFLGHIVPLLMMFLLPYALPSDVRESNKGVTHVTYELKLNPTLGAAVANTNTPTREKPT